MTKLIDTYKIALSSRYSRSPNELISFAHSNGFTGIEYTVQSEDTASLKNESEIINDIVKSDLEVRFHLQWRSFELAHTDSCFAEESLKYYKKCFDLLADFGGHHAIVHLGLGYRDKPNLICYEHAVKYLSEAVEYAAKKNITLCLENLTFGLADTAEKHLDLLKRTGASATIDIGHIKGCPAVLEGRCTAEDFIKTVGSYVRSAHIYDVEKPHKESGKIMHFAPKDEFCMESRIHKLMETPCTWWLIELGEAQEIIDTLGYLKNIWKKIL